jgi:hypothetical protein
VVYIAYTAVLTAYGYTWSVARLSLSRKPSDTIL